MKKLCSLFVFALIAGSIAVCGGCRNTSPNPDDSAFPPETLPTREQTAVSMAQPPAESPTAETPQTHEPPPSPEPKRTTIYYISYATGNYNMLVQGGVAQAGKDLDCDYILQGVPAADIDGQIRLIENAVASGADAIIISVVDSEAVAGAVSMAYRAEIPVVLVGDIEGTEDYSVCLMVDDFEAGRDAAAEMLRKLKSTELSEEQPAEIAVQIAAEESQTIIDRLEGFKTYWEENAPEQWVVLWYDIKVNGGYYDRAVEYGRELLAKYPNLKGAFAPNDLSTEGFAVALAETNRTDITLVGFGLQKGVEELVRNEDYNVSTMICLEYKAGYDAMTIAFDLANGARVAVKTIDVGVIAIDIENIDSPEVQKWLW